MTISTEGIVVSHVKYGDTSLIVKIFTEEEGMQSFIVKGARKKGGRFSMAYFFPLNQVEIRYVRSGQDSGLLYLKDLKSAYTYRRMYGDIRKSTVAMFLAEVMGRNITQSEQDKPFYHKIVQGLRAFDLRESDIAEFHLHFLMEMALSFGFCPKLNHRVSDVYFDMQEGSFVSCIPGHSDYLDLEASEDLKTLLSVHLQSGRSFPEQTLFSSSRRFALLQGLLHYVSLQTGSQGKVRSLDVLREVFS